jgi:hypothetical protein
MIWIDKGKVNGKVSMRPGIIRASFLPDYIRNASGNGGGLLFCYFPEVRERAITNFIDLD